MQESAGEQDTGRIQQLCAEGREAASFLQTFVVQGKLNERGNYGMAYWCWIVILLLRTHKIGLLP